MTPLLSNVALLVASDAPPGIESQIAPILERTKQEQLRWLSSETNYRFAYKLDVLRSRYNSAHFMTLDNGQLNPDICGNGVERARIGESAGWPGVERRNELKWPIAQDGGTARCYRRDIVYVGKGPNGYAGGGGNYSPGDTHDGTGEDYGECVYGGRNYWYLAGYGNSDCAGTFMNLTSTQYAHDHSHEGLHHYGIECHLKRYTAQTSMQWRDIAQAIGIGLRQFVENQAQTPLPKAIALVTSGGAYTTAGGETLLSLGWPAILDTFPTNVTALGGAIAPAGQAFWYPSALWLGEPMQAFQREMFIANSARFLEKVPATLPIPDPTPTPETPDPTPPDPLLVTPSSAIIHRYFGKRSVVVTASKPISLVKSLNTGIAIAEKTGDYTVKISHAPNVRPTGTFASGGLLAQVAIASGPQRVFVGVICRW